MRQPLVAGNWKMNGSRAGVVDLLDGIKAGMGDVRTAEVAVCPPFVFIPETAARLQGTAIAWGGQNLSTHASGAYTGEVAASMLTDFGCKYVIVGHSERRTLYGEDDAVVAEKFEVARKAGLVPIFCVGETLEERDAEQTLGVLDRQIKDGLDGFTGEQVSGFVIAYEPVWAIGTGRTATPEQAQDVHAFIRGRVAAKDAAVAAGIRILYGGSMKPDNAVELMAKPDIDGGLIGGAALKASDFLAICRAANR
jgi:triosephosphate isomerase